MAEIWYKAGRFLLQTFTKRSFESESNVTLANGNHTRDSRDESCDYDNGVRLTVRPIPSAIETLARARNSS